MKIVSAPEDGSVNEKFLGIGSVTRTYFVSSSMRSRARWRHSSCLLSNGNPISPERSEWTASRTA